VAMDIKAPKEKYDLVCQKKVNVKNIEKSIKLLKEGKVDYEFRTTIVPTLHAKEDILQILKWIRPAKKYYLQNFLPKTTINLKLESIKPYPQEFLLEIQKLIAPFFETCQIR
jgi:pyruvate formate lyase activating enzyme